MRPKIPLGCTLQNVAWLPFTTRNLVVSIRILIYEGMDWRHFPKKNAKDQVVRSTTCPVRVKNYGRTSVELGLATHKSHEMGSRIHLM